MFENLNRDRVEEERETERQRDRERETERETERRQRERDRIKRCKKIYDTLFQIAKYLQIHCITVLGTLKHKFKNRHMLVWLFYHWMQI